ncbi:MAG TPA: Ku protein [Rhizomicrobium sp.]|nr:Ku protein [Rhizomicrobium sp.]
MAVARKKASKAKASPRHANDDEVARPAGRPVWEGHLKLSLVSCPVVLYRATSSRSDISFHLLNPETNNRIRMVPTDPDTGPVNRSDLVKGYEIEKNRYIVLTNEELQDVRLETTHTLDIERFVAEDEIDRLYWNDPYFLLPAEKNGVEAYAVIRDAMNATGRIALGRVVMHTRERLMAVEPRGRGLLAYTLRARNEVLDVDAAFRGLPATKSDRKMLDIAEKIIDQQSGPFDPDQFEDRYETALRDLIARKEKGQRPITIEPPEDTNVVDLMEALRKSLKAKDKGRAAPARARALPARAKPARSKRAR